MKDFIALQKFTLRGDYSKAKNTFGWEPKVKFDELVKMMVEVDIDKLRKKGKGV